jgi:hypothetical protein
MNDKDVKLCQTFLADRGSAMVGMRATLETMLSEHHAKAVQCDRDGNQPLKLFHLSCIAELLEALEGLS